MTFVIIQNIRSGNREIKSHLLCINYDYFLLNIVNRIKININRLINRH